MTESRESESTPPVGRRATGWWWRPLGWSAAAIYLGQLVPFVTGPLTDCGHCVGNYLKYFLVAPGAIASQRVVGLLEDMIPGAMGLISGDQWRFFASGALILLVLLFSTTMITARTRGKWRWTWLGLLATLSAGNALFFAAVLRA